LQLSDKKYQSALERAKLSALREKFCSEDISHQKLDSLLIKGQSVLNRELSYAKSIPADKRLFVKVLEEATFE
jgi:hypothetical protein